VERGEDGVGEALWVEEGIMGGGGWGYGISDGKLFKGVVGWGGAGVREGLPQTGR